MTRLLHECILIDRSYIYCDRVTVIGMLRNGINLLKSIRKKLHCKLYNNYKFFIKTAVTQY